MFQSVVKISRGPGLRGWEQLSEGGEMGRWGGGGVGGDERAISKSGYKCFFFAGAPQRPNMEPPNVFVSLSSSDGWLLLRRETWQRLGFLQCSHLRAQCLAKNESPANL